MFDTFILQYLDKLIEREVGDFTSPQAFHSVYVQRFKSQCIKASTEIGGKFPVPVKTLPADFPIQPCQLTHSTPPVARPFFLTRKAFIQHAEVFQGLLMKLRTLYLFACGKCQIRVLHTEVCPNALTCNRQGFSRSIVCCNTKPVVPTIITLYRHLLNLTRFPLPVFVKRKRRWLTLPFTSINTPFTQGYSDMIICYHPTRYPWEGDRLELMLGFDIRSTSKFAEKSLICFMDAFQLTLDRLTWQTLPMRVCRLFQLSQMSRHRMVVRIRQSVCIALTLPQMEILMHFMHIVKQMTQAFILSVLSYLIFIGSHWTSRITRLTPAKWMADT